MTAVHDGYVRNQVGNHLLNLRGYRLEVTEYLSGFLHLISIDTFKEYFVRLPGKRSWILLSGG